MRRSRDCCQGIMVKSSGAPTLRRDPPPVRQWDCRSRSPGERRSRVAALLMKDELGQPIAKATVPHQRAVRLAQSTAATLAFACRLARGANVVTIEVTMADGLRGAKCPSGSLTALGNDAGTVLEGGNGFCHATSAIVLTLTTDTALFRNDCAGSSRQLRGRVRLCDDPVRTGCS